jgi:uncharacterized OB-fold protein
MEPKYGTPISSDDFFAGGVYTEEYVPRAEYRWDAGPAISRYLDGLHAGKLIGVECDECGSRLIPPRSFCDHCFKEVDRYIELPATGVVNTFSLCYITWDMQRLEVPQMPAVIDIDEASPGRGIMHLLGDIDPAEVAVGLAVEAVWLLEHERQGAITDISHWRPRP